MTPRCMSSMNAIPFQPAELIAVITITPGVRYSMYEPWKPGMSATRLKSPPNSSSQMTGWISVIATQAGWRTNARTYRNVTYPLCRMALISGRLLLLGAVGLGERAAGVAQVDVVEGRPGD